MTIVVGPVDAVSGAPSYTGEMARQTFGGGVVGGKTSTRPLGARSGVWPGTPTTTVSISGTTITIANHGGVLDLETSATAGPYPYAVTVPETKTLTAANATLDRIDLISLLLSDPAEGDGSSTPSVASVYTVGTPASTPVAPSTPARSLALATILVPHSGSGSPSVSWVGPYAFAAGGIGPMNSSTDRPTSPYVGQYVDDPTWGLLRWNGTIWDRPASGVPFQNTQIGNVTTADQAPGTPTTVATCPTVNVPIWAQDGSHTLTVTATINSLIITAAGTFAGRLGISSTTGPLVAFGGAQNDICQPIFQLTYTIPAATTSVAPGIQVERTAGTGAMRFNTSAASTGYYTFWLQIN